MTVPVFTGNVPNRLSSPETFSADTDSYHAELGGVIAGMNSTAIAMNLNSTTDTSVSSVTIGTGVKNFTVSTSKSFQAGMYLVIADTAAPTVNSMVVQVDSYNSGTGALVVNSIRVSGSGTKTAWVMSQSAAPSEDVSSVFVPVSSAASLADSRAAFDVPSTTEVNAALALKHGKEFLHVRDEKASGTQGGASAAGNQTRVLNTVVTNTITGASVASNQVTLPAGTYYVEADAVSSGMNQNSLSLKNITDTTTPITGLANYSPSGFQVPALLSGVITITATKIFSLNHFAAIAKTIDGFGIAVGSGQPEVFANLKFWKL